MEHRWGLCRTQQSTGSGLCPVRLRQLLRHPAIGTRPGSSKGSHAVHMLRHCPLLRMELLPCLGSQGVGQCDRLRVAARQSAQWAQIFVLVLLSSCWSSRGADVLLSCVTWLLRLLRYRALVEHLLSSLLLYLLLRQLHRGESTSRLVLFLAGSRALRHGALSVRHSDDRLLPGIADALHLAVVTLLCSAI